MQCIKKRHQWNYRTAVVVRSRCCQFGRSLCTDARLVWALENALEFTKKFLQRSHLVFSHLKKPGAGVSVFGTELFLPFIKIFSPLVIAKPFLVFYF